MVLDLCIFLSFSLEKAILSLLDISKGFYSNLLATLWPRAAQLIEFLIAITIMDATIT